MHIFSIFFTDLKKIRSFFGVLDEKYKYLEINFKIFERFQKLLKHLSKNALFTQILKKLTNYASVFAR